MSNQSINQDNIVQCIIIRHRTYDISQCHIEVTRLKFLCIGLLCSYLRISMESNLHQDMYVMGTQTNNTEQLCSCLTYRIVENAEKRSKKRVSNQSINQDNIVQCIIIRHRTYDISQCHIEVTRLKFLCIGLLCSYLRISMESNLHQDMYVMGTQTNNTEQLCSCLTYTGSWNKFRRNKFHERNIFISILNARCTISTSSSCQRMYRIRRVNE